MNSVDKEHCMFKAHYRLSMIARCYSLAVDLPEHSAVVEQLAYIQRGGSSILSVPIGGGADIKPQQRSFCMTSSCPLGVFFIYYF